MAERKTATILQASDGCKAWLCAKGEHSTPRDDGNSLWISLTWPLAEFDELVEFVREHQKNLKQAEVQTVG